MEEINIIRQKLLKSIETLTVESQTGFEKFIDPRHSNTFETKYIENYKKTDNEIPETVTFKAGLANRILMTVLLLTLLVFVLICGFQSRFEKGELYFIIFFGVFFIILFVKMWFNSDFKNRLILSENGIAYNDDLYYWKDIVVTQIQYIYKRKDREGYLYVGLNAGSIKILNITNLQFGSFLFGSSKRDELVLGHYIEVFKKRNK